MYSHAPEKYECPICLGVKGIESEATLLMQADRIYEDGLVTAFINSFWLKGNEGHVIVVPNEHYENIYDMPDDAGARVFSVSKKIAMAMKKAYKCDGITIRQNNEPASDQHAFHYHMHVFPRFNNDKFNQNQSDKFLSDVEKRLNYVKDLKSFIDDSYEA